MLLLKSRGMKIAWKNVVFFNIIILLIILIFNNFEKCKAQDYGDEEAPPPPPPQQDNCDGIVLSYTFNGREKLYPHLKNASAQAWSFEAQFSITNQASIELKAWQASVTFQYHELLVSVDGATVLGGDGFPFRVGKNATVFVGYPMTDLKTAIETAGDESQIQVLINIKGTMFGLKKGDPMPKNIKLANPGYKCPAAKRRGNFFFFP